jgi:hypothetical protein
MAECVAYQKTSYEECQDSGPADCVLIDSPAYRLPVVNLTLTAAETNGCGE